MFALFVILLFLSANTSAERKDVNQNPIDQGCGEHGDCVNNDICENRCGCHSSEAVLFYNETLDECVVNVKKLLMSLTEKHNTQDNIRQKVDKIFQGILFSAILFVTCATTCMLTACVYCCRINYMDTRLKNDVEALANKLNRDLRFRKTIKKPTQPGEENCNIIVPGTDVFVV
ncbi:unnamed protein product, partial [Brenthis ino]